MPALEYACARVRAMRSRLLGEAGIRELLAQPGLGARLDLLRKTGYAVAVAAHAAGEADPLQEAERGLRATLGDDLLRIDRFLIDDAARSLLRAALAFEDAFSLKTILRGVAANEPAERTFLLVAPTPGFEDAALRELVGQEDVKGVVDLLVTWGSPYAAPLEDAFRRYLAHRELLVLETALDRFVFAQALERAAAGGREGRILRGILERQIDLANAATLLKLAATVSGDEFFIPGGRRIDLGRYLRLARLGEREVRSALFEEARLHLDPRLAALAERGDAFAVDQALRDALAEDVRKEARIRPLSIAVPLSFLQERQAEVRRIRLVLRGAEFGLPADDLLSLVEVSWDVTGSSS
jgi:V/A-type H+-transporting ATPase subunit C